MSDLAHWTLKNDKDEIICEFESSVPVKLFQQFMKENMNRFDKEKFIKFVNSFVEVKNKFSILI